jgi:metal-dependent amidase/aminoacylase/carboxypeptidase family protein
MTNSLPDQAKAAIRDLVAKRADLLVSVSREIHAHPELNYQEVFAHDLLTKTLHD